MIMTDEELTVFRSKKEVELRDSGSFSSELNGARMTIDVDVIACYAGRSPMTQVLRGSAV